MQRIHNSPFYTIDWIESKKLFEFRFIDTSNMTWENFQDELLTQVQLAQTYSPKYYFFDTLHFDFPITPEMQNWIDSMIFTEFVKAGVLRYAYLVSKEFFSQLSIELLMNEKTASAFETKYFITEVEAKEWLLS